MDTSSIITIDIIPNCILHYILNKINFGDVHDNYFFLVLVAKVSNIFYSISKEIIINKKLCPKPKFEIGTYVRYTDQYISENKKKTDELYKKYGNTVGELPYGKLYISENPIWNEKLKDFKYYYEYGIFHNHEGSTLGKNLIKFN